MPPGCEEEKDGRNNAAMDEQRADWLERARAYALLENRRQRLENRGHVREGRVVEVRASVGDLPKPDGRKVRPRFGLGGKGRDEQPNLFHRRQIGRGDVAHPDAKSAEHVAEDVSVKLGFVLEVVVDHRLVQAGGGGDLVDAGAGKAVGGEGAGGSGKDAIAGGVGGGGRPALAACLAGLWRRSAIALATAY